MNTQEIRDQIEGLHDIADEQVLPEHYQLHKTADSMKALLKENEALIEILHQNGISVDLTALGGK